VLADNDEVFVGKGDGGITMTGVNFGDDIRNAD
jgi:hypothetical protein